MRCHEIEHEEHAFWLRLAADLCSPWERWPGPSGPDRGRRGFPNIRHRLGTPARVVKPT